MATAIRTASLSKRGPQEVMGKASNQSPVWGDEAAIIIINIITNKNQFVLHGGKVLDVYDIFQIPHILLSIIPDLSDTLPLLDMFYTCMVNLVYLVFSKWIFIS